VHLSFPRRNARLRGAGPAVVGMVSAALLGSGLVACGGGGSETTTGGPPLDLRHANLQPSDLPPGWKPATPPDESLAKHIFVCLDKPGSNPEDQMSATGPGQLTVISDVVGWPTVTEAQTATFAAQGTNAARSCVGSSLHFLIPGIGTPPSVSPSKIASQVRALAGAARPTVAYEVSFHGANGAARGAVVVTTRGRATAVILAYRPGQQPFPPRLLSGLVASASQRLGEATPAGS
jgi:hypothetical protein